MPKLRFTRLSLFIGLILIVAITVTIVIATSDRGADPDQQADSTGPDEPAPTEESVRGEPTSPPPSPSPQATSSAVATPQVPTATPRSPPTAVAAAPTATPDVFEIDCSTPLQSVIDRMQPGGNVDLTGCTYDTAARITKPVTIVGATISLQVGSPWAPVVTINSDDVTLDRWTINGGGAGVSILGRSNVRIANSTFEGGSGSAIAIWGEGRGANNITIEGNRIVQTRTNKVSPITGRASENCSVYSRNLTVRGNTIDQGQGDSGWFGIELKCHDGVTISGNNLRGGQVLVSLPSSNNVSVTGNTFDMRGRPYWGVEVPKANNVTVSGNTFTGDGASSNDHAVSMNSGSQNTTVIGNNLSDMRTLIDLGGNHVNVRDNCLSNVSRVTEFDSSGGANVNVTNNGPC